MFSEDFENIGAAKRVRTSAPWFVDCGSDL